MMEGSSPVTHDYEVGTTMSPIRRIAAAALVGALGFGFVGISSAPANADFTWGLKTKVNP